MSLQTLLESRKCIKIICGAGNENIEQIRHITDIYARAGVRYFDISANIEAIRTVKQVLQKLNIEGYICVSYGIKGDPHTKKIKVSEACINCGKCVPTCSQKALYQTTDAVWIMNDSCIGCGTCIPACSFNALSLSSIPKNIEDTLPDIVAEGVDTIEFHANGALSDIDRNLSSIENLHTGMISICMDRSLYGDKQLIDIFTKFITHRTPYSTIIQADGLPMEGNNDSPGITLQAIAFGQIIARAKLPVYLLLSGGTNDKTSYLAQQMGFAYNGISVGSFARKIIDGSSDVEAVQKACNFIHHLQSFMGYIV